MAEKEAFEQMYDKLYGKVRYAYAENGAVSHVIKQIDPELKEIYQQLMQVRCSNLAVIYGITEENGEVLVHQEYIDGECVSEWTGDPGDTEIIRMAMDVAQALKAVHALQPPIIHRDIKPSNIMRRKNGSYVLVDFDASRRVNPEAMGDTQIMGTVGYAAPEQFGLMQTDARSDIFSLGATLYWIKTGKPVRSGSKCPGRLGRIVDKCTQLEPSKRYKSAEKLLQALEREEKHVPVQPMRIAAAAVACALSFAAGAWTMHGIQQHAESEYADCTCRFIATQTLDHVTQVQEFHPGDAPVELQLNVEGFMDAEGCTAAKHRTAEMASVRDVRLQTSTQETKAHVERNGKIMLEGCGVYAVDAGVFLGGRMEDLVTETIVLTEHPEIYNSCSCEALQRESYVEFKGNRMLRKGDVVKLKITPCPVIDRHGCTATKHQEIFPSRIRILRAPSGAECGVTEDQVFYTDTAGDYVFHTEYFFGTWACFSVDTVTIEEMQSS